MSVNYSLGAGKPLINREQSYVLDRKLLTVHSEDRDISKWPNANEFEIILPQQLLNIQSMRLVEIETPFTSQLNAFSTMNQNTKLIVSYNGNANQTITIKTGTYTPTEMVTEINAEFALAAIVITCSFTNGVIQFTSDNDYILHFELGPTYSNPCPNDNNPIFKNTFNWGLPYNLGFLKQQYSTVTLGNKTITASSVPNLVPDTCMYMEIDKYNSYDEMYPANQSEFDHSSSSNIKLINGNNSYQGRINSAFAKIPLITTSANNYVFESRNIGLQNITHYEPPLERVGRLKFKFRFHDGRLVDFQNIQFNFTIEFNMLRNEMGKQINVRIPSTYTL